MKVFISWSGKRSKEVGELLDEWLQCVLQAVTPWMSSKDIDRGSLWFSEINDQLADTSIGIVCLTSANINNPWILFESGALAKGLSSNRVCTFLIDIVPTDINDPLAQFNHTLPDKDGLWLLVQTLNKTLGDKKLGEKVLLNVFETYWPQFELKFKQILDNTQEETTNVKRGKDDIMLELLSTVRALEKRLRRMENESLQSKVYAIDNNKVRSEYENNKIKGLINILSNELVNKDINNLNFTEIMEDISNKYGLLLSRDDLYNAINELKYYKKMA